jgi:predicted DNA binding CopG/RHH family protein
LPSKQKSPDPVTSKEVIEKREAEIGGAQDSLIQESVEDLLVKESKLILSLSSTLVRRLSEKAQREGVSIQDFASELLAEGLVLRAWEIVEKKNTMRGISPNSNNSPSQASGSYRNPKAGYRNNQQNGHVKRMSDSGSSPKNISRQSYKNIMEDNANFLEYVRSQEKRDRY